MASSSTVDVDDSSSQLSFHATATTDDDVRAYNQYASAAVDLSQAQHYASSTAGSTVSSSGTGTYSHFSVVRSARDIDNNKRVKYLYTTTLLHNSDDDNVQVPPMTPPVQLPDDVQWRLVSPSGRKIAILVKQSNVNGGGTTAASNGKPQQVLQIWTNNGQLLERIIPMGTSNKLHGNVVYEPGGFGRPTWSPDETCLLYSAERKAPETTSFFTDTKPHNAGGEHPTTTAFRGGEYTLGIGKPETWGEKYNQLSPLLDLFIVNIETGQIGMVANVPGRGRRRGSDDDNTEEQKHSINGEHRTKMMTTMGSYTFGQAVWSPSGQSIVYTGWDAGDGGNMPRRLGLIYCQQRPSKLYVSNVTSLLQTLSSDLPTSPLDEEPGEQDVDGGFTVLTPDLWIAKSPRFSPIISGDGSSSSISKMVFLATEKAFNTHSGCFGLHAIDWNIRSDAGVDEPILGTKRIIVRQVWNPVQEFNDKTNPRATVATVAGLPFPGLFVDGELVSDPFVSPTEILVTTQWGSCQKIIKVCLSTGSIHLLLQQASLLRLLEGKEVGNGESDVDGTIENHQLLCIGKDGSAFVLVTDPKQPGSIFRVTNAVMGNKQTLPEGGDKDKRIQHTQLTMIFQPISATIFSPGSSSLLPKFHFDVSIETLSDVPKFDNVDTDLAVQSILLLPDKSKHPNPPLIVCPHGGPHGAYVKTYFHSLSYLCGYGGYAVLIPNYRGSTGFGQASVEALPTRIGEMDVQDLIASTNQIIRSGKIEPNRIGICGGSHGGFLTTHCTSQYPDIFKAASTRNPVVNIASMYTATDIPDWCLVEATGSYNWKEYQPASKEELDKMYSASPVKRVRHVKAPTLVGLGMVDLRVPPSQGLEWYHSLRSMGIPTKLLTYPSDCHAIDSSASEADYWIHTKQWFDKYLRSQT